MRFNRSFWACCLLLALASVSVAGNDPGEKILIRASKPYAAVVARVESLGGTVTQQYKNIDAIAAEVPRASLSVLRAELGAAAISKDEEIQLPNSMELVPGKALPAAAQPVTDLEFDSADVIAAEDIASLAAINPEAYRVNNVLSQVSTLHAGNFLGQGMVVAVIDSGIRPGFPHISLDGSVVGCQDFVGDALGCSNFGNNGHGTFVAGMISANVNFTFSAASALRNGVLAHCPTCFSNPPTNTTIPMIGSAPLSSIYALRVFGATGGSPTSRILAAFDRAIQLRELFDSGMPGGANIQVINMSLGGATTFAGRDLFDQAVNAALDKNIVLAIAAGNAGPSSLTVGSPGTAIDALTVCASSLTHNERILRHLQFGAAVGQLYRPAPHHQTATFSARGPSADGRHKPDLCVNGFANYGQGTGGTVNTVSLGSGTSFATPTVAGIAAVLRQRFPGATARQIQNALRMSANPNIITDGSNVVDQGAGYVDAAAAAALLAGGTVPDSFPPPPSFVKSVKVNVENSTPLNVRNGFIREHIADLKPGQRADVLYRILPNTKQVIVDLSGVTPALPPAQQNQLFGDDILLTIHSAKTSSISQGDYKVFAFTKGGVFTLNDPEPGLMRITVNGDWTNAGAISAHLAVVSISQPVPQLTAQGLIANGQTLLYMFDVPAGAAQAQFRLEWREDWGNYPSGDLDLILIAPNNSLNFAGATLNNPELATINNPMPGTWRVLVDGAEVHVPTDRFELRVTLDGKVIR